MISPLQNLTDAPTDAPENLQALSNAHTEAFECLQYLDALAALCCAEGQQATLTPDHLLALLLPLRGPIGQIVEALE